MDDRLSRSVPPGGFIARGQLYALAEAVRRLGVGSGWIREARRCGLRVHYRHSRLFVTGDALIDYIEASETQEPVAAQLRERREDRGAVVAVASEPPETNGATRKRGRRAAAG